MTPDQENRDKRSVLGMIKSLVKNKLQNTVIKSEIQLTDTQTQQAEQIDKIKQDILTKCMAAASKIEQDISKNRIMRFLQKHKQLDRALLYTATVEELWNSSNTQLSENNKSFRLSGFDFRRRFVGGYAKYQSLKEGLEKERISDQTDNEKTSETMATNEVNNVATNEVNNQPVETSTNGGCQRAKRRRNNKTRRKRRAQKRTTKRRRHTKYKRTKKTRRRTNKRKRK